MQVKILGVIGDPIAHSLSPTFQNAAFRRTGLPYFYFPFLVKPNQLASFVKTVRNHVTDFLGFNVTVPHKQAVMKYLDWIAPEARSIGAVNTVMVQGEKLLGYNTDASGYLRSLKECRFLPRGKIVLILGAGGAARAILYALTQAGARDIFLCNRTFTKAKNLAREFQKKFPRSRIKAISWNEKDLKLHLKHLNLLVNATSAALKASSKQKFPFHLLSRKTYVSDLVYHPIVTGFLSQATRKKMKIHPGWRMLLHQGAESFRLWTGRNPPLAAMKKALLDGLK